MKCSSESTIMIDSTHPMTWSPKEDSNTMKGVICNLTEGPRYNKKARKVD